MRRSLERMINLLAFLLTVGRPVTADVIRFTVAGYDQGSDEAFRRMFERDKDLLRSLGVPIQTRPTDSWEVEFGYVVPPSSYQLPDPGLTDDERAALWLAAQMVRLGGHPQGPEAIFKLGGAPFAAGGELMAADLGAEIDSLGELYGAVTERRHIQFTYKGDKRRMAPWGLGHRKGHWYLVGSENGEQRTFRVDRMTGLRVADPADAFARPKRFDLRKALQVAAGEGLPSGETAEVIFDEDVAFWAERQLPAGSQSEPHPSGGVRSLVPVRNRDSFLGWLLGFGASAELIAPADLRRLLVDRVEASVHRVSSNIENRPGEESSLEATS